MIQLLSAILLRVANPVEPFGVKFLHGRPLLSSFDGIGEDLRKPPDHLDQFDESQADKI